MGEKRIIMTITTTKNLHKNIKNTLNFADKIVGVLESFIGEDGRQRSKVHYIYRGEHYCSWISTNTGATH